MIVTTFTTGFRHQAVASSYPGCETRLSSRRNTSHGNAAKRSTPHMRCITETQPASGKWISSAIARSPRYFGRALLSATTVSKWVRHDRRHLCVHGRRCMGYVHDGAHRHEVAIDRDDVQDSTFTELFHRSAIGCFANAFC